MKLFSTLTHKVSLKIYSFTRIALALIMLPALIASIFAVPGVRDAFASPLAGNPDGVLKIEPITAYNFVVDSNVLTPATYGPKAATLGAKVCNTGPTALANVFAYIGNFKNLVYGEFPKEELILESLKMINIKWILVFSF